MVKCQECGFLTVRVRDTRELCESESDIRYSGKLPSQGGYYIYEERPLCFQRQSQFRIDTMEAVAGSFSADQRLEVFSRERECSAFTEWQQGFTPREHQEMLDRKLVVEREDRRDSEMREREDRRDEQTRKLQERLHNKELWILGGLATIALVGGSVAAAIIEGAINRGWQPSWWPF